MKIFADSGYAVTGLTHTTVGGASALLQPISKVLSIAGIDTGTLAEEADHYQYIVIAEKMTRSPKLTSIIILTCNQLEYTKKCVESIQKHTPQPHEIIFVDNGSTDGTREYIEQLASDHEHIQLILNEKNLGFAAGNNQAIQKAGGDYLLLLNNDTVVTEKWLGTLIQHLNESPDTGMVGSHEQLGFRPPTGAGYALRKFSGRHGGVRPKLYRRQSRQNDRAHEAGGVLSPYQKRGHRCYRPP
ncbi:MAG: glycosyltransferase family 2 protein [Desulfomonilia bacterium]